MASSSPIHQRWLAWLPACHDFCKSRAFMQKGAWVQNYCKMCLSAACGLNCKPKSSSSWWSFLFRPFPPDSSVHSLGELNFFTCIPLRPHINAHCGRMAGWLDAWIDDSGEHVAAAPLWKLITASHQTTNMVNNYYHSVRMASFRRRRRPTKYNWATKILANTVSRWYNKL